jgi:hypothetical protein
MNTLAIVKNRAAATYHLVSAQPVGYGSQRLGLLEAFVPFGSFSTRPDAVHRAWAHLEAKRGMAAQQEAPAAPAPAPPVKQNTLAGWLRKLAIARTPSVLRSALKEVHP